MPYDDYSDSDDESNAEEIQTTVLLGLPDGPIASASDLSKPRISRIGGLPVYPAGVPHPPNDATQCSTCSKPMELLIQLWCPFESSAYDRTLHVWGCSRVSCQRKSGTIKAIRALRFNQKYATKLEAKKAKEAARQAPVKAPQSKANPFSSSTASTGQQLFGGGFGDDDWGAPPSSTSAPKEDSTKSPEDNKDGSSSSGDPSSASEAEEEDDEVDELAQVTSALESTTLAETASSATSPTTENSAPTPSHPALYLDTLFEYITPPSLPSKTKSASKQDDDGGSGAGAEKWALEGYEKTQGIDDIFERFVSRVEHEPQQVIRYDLGGVPLPFSTEPIFKRLFPLASALPPTPGTKVIATGGAESLDSTQNAFEGQKRVYDARTIPPCDACGGARQFECQLMPNLINVIRAARKASSSSKGKGAAQKKKAQSDEERKAEVARLLGDSSASKLEGDDDAEGDMEWGTALVFSCAKDCCRVLKSGGKAGWEETQAGWKDEYVLVQWDV